jgi:hypothetical protein
MTSAQCRNRRGDQELRGCFNSLGTGILVLQGVERGSDVLDCCAMKAVWIAILWCLTPTTTTAIGSGQSGPSLPDVFLITIDTLRADHVHCYGSNRVETPTLDNLCEDGIRFSQAFTPSPITNSSHATILTGLLPSFHGVTDFGVPLATTHPTAAVLLKAKGYHTAAFIGSVILDSRSLA